MCLATVILRFKNGFSIGFNILGEKLLSYLKNISPSKADLEFKSLAFESLSESENLCSKLARFLGECLVEKRNYFMLQSYLNLVVKVGDLYVELFLSCYFNSQWLRMILIWMMDLKPSF